MEASPILCAWCSAPAAGFSESHPTCINCCKNSPFTSIASSSNLCKSCGKKLETDQLICNCQRKYPKSPPIPLVPTPPPRPEQQPHFNWSCYANSTGWELWGCASGHSMNTMQDLVCRTCDLVSAIPEARGITLAGNSGKAAAAWTCFACRKLATGKTKCELCGCLRTWAGFLRTKGIELSSDQSRWKCTICGDFNELHEGICSQCHENQQIIMRWAQPRKQETPSGREAFSCGCCSPQ